MKREFDRKIILPDGRVFPGYAFGAVKDAILELVFNTSMAGYQEILSDPSYTDQAVVMTYPLIGNYGMAADDYESDAPRAGALIVREYNDLPSHCRSAGPLGDVMRRYGVAGISSVDTRRLCRVIRDQGSQPALLTGIDTPIETGLAALEAYQAPRDAASRVSCKNIYRAGGETAARHVVAVDCGMKKSILTELLARGCRVTVVPWDTPADAILALHPDGVLVSNGPGDPADVPQTIGAVRQLLGKTPLFGICLGHQILSLACGARTYKLKFGHRGGNHPVRVLATGRIEITSQNHSYAVDADSLRGTGLAVTRVNLLDGTVEGVACERAKAFGVQYHPESAPGPQDSAHLFDDFIRLMREGS